MEKARRQQLNEEFREWAYEAVASSGSGAQQWAKSSAQLAEDEQDPEGEPLTAQDTAEMLREEWRKQVWRCGEPEEEPDWDIASMPVMERPSIKQLRDTCRSFKKRTSTHWEGLHPRHLGQLSGGGLEKWLELFEMMEKFIVVPKLWQELWLVFIPKASGGAGPSGCSVAPPECGVG